jgi:hypothetical protein
MSYPNRPQKNLSIDINRETLTPPPEEKKFQSEKKISVTKKNSVMSKKKSGSTNSNMFPIVIREHAVSIKDGNFAKWNMACRRWSELDSKREVLVKGDETSMLPKAQFRMLVRLEHYPPFRPNRPEFKSKEEVDRDLCHTAWVWLTRQQLEQCYTSVGHCKVRTISMHEVFRPNQPVRMFFDLDEIPRADLEFTRPHLEQLFCHFMKLKYQLEVQAKNILWQDSSWVLRPSDSKGETKTFKKGSLKMVLVGYVFPNILVCRCVASQFKQFVDEQTDRDLSPLAKYIDLSPYGTNKSLRMVGSSCTKSVSDPAFLDHLDRVQCLHPISMTRGFTYQDAWLTSEIKPTDVVNMFSEQDVANMSRMYGKKGYTHCAGEELRVVLRGLVERLVQPIMDTKQSIQFDCNLKISGNSVLVNLRNLYCPIKKGRHSQRKPFLLLKPASAVLRCEAKSCRHTIYGLGPLEDRETRELFPGLVRDERDIMCLYNAPQNQYMGLDIQNSETCPELPLVYQRSEKRMILVQSAMCTQKTTQVGNRLAVQCLKDAVAQFTFSETQTPQVFTEQFIKGQIGHRTRILYILPRILAVVNVLKRVNDLISKQMEDILKRVNDLISKQIEDIFSSISSSSSDPEPWKDDLRDFLCFQDYREVKDPRQAGRVITCVPSVFKFTGEYDMVIMDESESNLALLTSSCMSHRREDGAQNKQERDKMIQCAQAIQCSIRSACSPLNPHAAGVYMLDADLSAKSVQFALDMQPPGAIQIIQNKHQRDHMKHEYRLYLDDLTLFNVKLKGRDQEPKTLIHGPRDAKQLHESACLQWYGLLHQKIFTEHKKVFVVTTSRAEGFRLMAALEQHYNGLVEEAAQNGEAPPPQPKWEYHSAQMDEAKKDNLRDLNQAFKNLDVVVFTPIITVGSDFSVENHFDEIFCYCSVLSADFETVFQAVGRIRRLKEKVVHVYLDRSYAADGNQPCELGLLAQQQAAKEETIMTLEKNWQVLERKKDVTPTGFRALPQSLDQYLEPVGGYFAPKWLKNIYLYNTLQANLSHSDFLVSMIKHFMRKQIHWIIEPPSAQFGSLAEAKSVNKEFRALKNDGGLKEWYEDDTTYPCTDQAAHILRSQQNKPDSNLTHQEKLYLLKIQFFDYYFPGELQTEGQTIKDKPPYQHVRDLILKNTQGNKRKMQIITGAHRRAGHTGDDFAILNKHKMVHPGQELKGGMSASAYQANALDNVISLLCQTDPTAEKSWAHLTLDNEIFHTNKKCFVDRLQSTASVFQIKVPENPKWMQCTKVLNEILKHHAMLTLVPVCKRPECKGKPCTNPSPHRDSRRLLTPSPSEPGPGGSFRTTTQKRYARIALYRIGHIGQQLNNPQLKRKGVVQNDTRLTIKMCKKFQGPEVPPGPDSRGALS